MLLALVLSAALAGETMTLDEALARLESDNPDLAAVEARADSARGVTRQALAALLPVLAVGGQVVRNDIAVELNLGEVFADLPPGLAPEGLPDQMVLQPLTAATGQATLRVPIVAANAYSDRAAAARSARAADAQAEGVRVALRTSLVEAAVAQRAAASLLEVGERGVALSEAHRDRVQRATEAGTAGRLELLGAEADVLSRRAVVLQARSDLERSERLMGTLLAMEVPVRVSLPVALELPPAPDETPAVQAARLTVGAADARVDSAWWRLSPTIAAFGTARASTSPFPSGRETQWQVGAELVWPLYDGGLRYGKLEQARADRVGAEALLRSEQLKADQAQDDAQRAVRLATDQVVLTTAQRDLARQGAEVARRGLEAGMVTALDTRDAEDRAWQAEVAVVLAEARVLGAQAALARALGSAW